MRLQFPSVRTLGQNKSADFRQNPTLSLEVFSYKETGDEEGIHVDGSIGETTGVRWPARATMAVAAAPTTRSDIRKRRGGIGARLLGKMTKAAGSRGGFSIKRMGLSVHES